MFVSFFSFLLENNCELLPLSILVLISYLLGSIPFGLIIVKLVNKTDIRQQGSGNIGATNTVRVLGKKWGAVVFLLDGLKAFFPIIFIKYITSFNLYNNDYILLFIGIVTIIGHCFPIWLKFKGGKGISSLIFVLLALNYKIGVFFIVIWVSVYKLTKISALSALSAVILTNVLVFFLLQIEVFYLFILLTLIIIYKHKENIKRILNGEELSFLKK
jgi:glycerol-3-phosphate acyltransferase PlsY